MPRIPFHHRIRHGCGCVVFVAAGLVGAVAAAALWQPAETRPLMTVCEGTEIYECVDGVFVSCKRTIREPMKCSVMDYATVEVAAEVNGDFCGPALLTLALVRPVGSSATLWVLQVSYYLGGES